MLLPIEADDYESPTRYIPLYSPFCHERGFWDIERQLRGEQESIRVYGAFLSGRVSAAERQQSWEADAVWQLLRWEWEQAELVANDINTIIIIIIIWFFAIYFDFHFLFFFFFRHFSEVVLFFYYHSFFFIGGFPSSRYLFSLSFQTFFIIFSFLYLLLLPFLHLTYRFFIFHHFSPLFSLFSFFIFRFSPSPPIFMLQRFFMRWFDVRACAHMMPHVDADAMPCRCASGAVADALPDVAKAITCCHCWRCLGVPRCLIFHVRVSRYFALFLQHFRLMPLCRTLISSPPALSLIFISFLLFL